MRYLIVLLFVIVLVACGMPAHINDDQINNNNDDQENIEENDQSTEVRKNLQEVADNAFYHTTLTTDEGNKELYIQQLTEQEEINGHIFNNFIFFLANPDDDYAVAQTDLAIYEDEFDFNAKVTFETVEFSGQSMVMLIKPLTNNSNEIMFWTVQLDELQEVMFDNDRSIISMLANGNVKFIKDIFLQTLIYYDDENRRGWTFYTWEYKQDESIFTRHYEKPYLINEDDLTSGEYLSDLWLSFDDYYTSFPYYTLTTDDIEKFSNGKLFDLPFAFGTPIEEVAEHYTIFEEGYYDGGAYYSTNDGLYFYNERTELVSVMYLSGNVLTNPHDIENILGKPKSSGQNDLYPDELYAQYDFGDNMLWLTFSKDGELTFIEFHSNEYK